MNALNNFDKLTGNIHYHLLMTLYYTVCRGQRSRSHSQQALEVAKASTPTVGRQSPFYSFNFRSIDVICHLSLVMALIYTCNKYIHTGLYCVVIKVKLSRRCRSGGTSVRPHTKQNILMSRKPTVSSNVMHFPDLRRPYSVDQI